MSSSNQSATHASRKMNAASERIGRIVAVTGAHAIILLDADDPFSASPETSPEIGTLLKVDTERNQNLAARFDIRSIPTLLFFREGRLVERLVGALPKQEIEKHLLAIIKTN